MTRRESEDIHLVMYTTFPAAFGAACILSALAEGTAVSFWPMLH
jgi:hypothetical protein